MKSKSRPKAEKKKAKKVKKPIEYTKRENPWLKKYFKEVHKGGNNH